jgi:hypothetical protein
MLSKLFSNQINEIKNSIPLQNYGGFLSLIFLFQSLYWYKIDANEKLAYTQEAICWPFFHDCSSFRFLGNHELLAVFLLIGLFSILNSYFFFKKKIKIAYFGLISLEIISLLIILLDYRMRLNQNIMIFFILITYLFVNSREKIIPWVIVSFYFWAGFLKIRPDWISGQAIYGHLLLIPDKLKSEAAIYVIFLELILIWGLLLKDKRIRWFVLFNLFIFHLASFGVVGFYYPILMSLILSIFFIKNYNQSAEAKNFSKSGSFVIIVLFAFNIRPYFLPGDLAITGESRILSLHMFDSIITCDPKAILHRKNQPDEIVGLQIPSVVRIKCDPIVFLSRARTICRNNMENKLFLDLDLSLNSKTISENNFHEVINVKNFCSKKLEYSIWGNNSWILKK